jgi:spore coat protein CotH
MQTLKELHTSAKTRLDAVSRRIDALQLELDELVKEQLVLEELVEVYDKKDYDSIEEERRVTGRVLLEARKNRKSTKETKSPDFVSNFVEVYKEVNSGKMSIREAINLLDISTSTYYRLASLHAKEAVQDGKPVQ